MGTEEITNWLGDCQSSRLEKRTDEHVLWLHGNPGTGKSTMAIFLTEYLGRIFSETTGKTLIYYFCDSGSDKQRTATSIVRGLLLQLLQQYPSLVNYILPKFNERGAILFNSFEALWPIFMAAAADPDTGRKYCIIDALDECDEAPRKMLLKQIQETFWGTSTTNIHILITSRKYRSIEERLIKFPNRDLASFLQIQTDINQCMEEKVEYLAELKGYTDAFKGRVKAVLREKAEKTFLWIGLACRELEDADGEDAIVILKNMPEELHLLYRSLLDKASGNNQDDSEIIRRILSCVAVSRRPLSVAELSEACQLYQEENDEATRFWLTEKKVATFHLLLIVQGDKVLLLHKSVRDFIVGSDYGHFIDIPLAHAELSYRCIDSLIKWFHGDGRQAPPRLSQYACYYWADHAHDAQTRFEIRDSESEFFEFDSPCRENWLKKLNRFTYRNIPAKFSILHVAAYWGIPAIVRFASSFDRLEPQPDKSTRRFDCNIVDSTYRTALEQAAKTPHVDVINELLRLETRVTSTTFLLAAENRLAAKEVMTLLLDQRGDGIIITEKLTQVAVLNDKSGLEVMKLLFDRYQAEIPVTDAVIAAAAENISNGKEILELFLDRRGSEVKITEQVMRAAAANFSDGYRIIAMLLDRQGSEIIITEEVVFMAIKSGKQTSAIMALLLEQQCKRIPTTEKVVTAIVKHCDEAVIDLLLHKYKNTILINFNVVKATAANKKCHNKAMALLFKRKHQKATITEPMVTFLLEKYDIGVVEKLFHAYGPFITITEAVVEAAARNYNNRDELLRILYGHWQGMVVEPGSQHGMDQAPVPVDHAVSPSPFLSWERLSTRDDWPTESVVELNNMGDEVWGVEFSNDGKKLAAYGCGATVLIWEVPLFTVVQSLKGHGSGIGHLAWSPDNTMVLTSSQDQHARLYNVHASNTYSYRLVMSLTISRLAH